MNKAENSNVCGITCVFDLMTETTVGVMGDTEV